MTLYDGHWKIEGEYLTIELRGYKIADYWYWYNTRFKLINLDRNNMILEMGEIIKNKEMREAMFLEDLLRD